MEFNAGTEHLQLAYLAILQMAGPVLAVALAVGLAVGVLQAATSINEATLSFVPKLVIVFITMAVGASFMLGVIADYFNFIFDSIGRIR